MRADMAKVLVERERSGNRIRFGHRRHAFERATRGSHDEGAPAASMPMRFATTKGLNENLRPLERFLRARVGRLWDEVYAEIRSRLAPKRAVDMHVLQHLWDYVLFARRNPDGRIWLVWRRGAYAYERLPDGRLVCPTRFRGDVYYVCCDTGALRYVGRERTTRRRSSRPPRG